MDFEQIEQKHQKLIEIAKNYMLWVRDPEHNVFHMQDVVEYTKQIVESMILERLVFDAEACIVGAYWHDVGRTKIGEGHEKLSAEMLKQQMKELGYNDGFIQKCYDAIEFHKWNMEPRTIEGLILKDADKIAFIGNGRWQECLQAGYKLDSIIELLPRLRNEILHFEISKKIYDREIVRLVKQIYNFKINK